MYKRVLAKLKKLDRKNQSIAISVIALIVIAVVFFITQLSQPVRSVGAYCNVYQQEKARLSAMSDQSNPYPSGLFNVNVTDAEQIALSLGRLDRVSPSQIEPETNSLQKLYQDIHNNPSRAINDSLNGGSLDDSLNAWTKSHCDARQ